MGLFLIQVFQCKLILVNGLKAKKKTPVGLSNCSQQMEDLSIPVTFPIYVMALMSFVGWFLLVLFGGVGLGAIPLDFINKFRFRPQRLTRSELDAKERMLRERARDLIEIGKQIKISKSEVTTEESWNSRRKLKNTLRKDINRLQAETLLLEQDYETFLVEKGETKRSPLWYPFYLVIGLVCLCVSVLWILQILLYILINTNGLSASPLLNKVLNGLNTPGTSFLSTIIFCLLTMYLMLAVLKGNVKFGLRFFFCCKAHPIKKDNTPMNSMLFNCLLILISSVAVILFCKT